MYTGTHTRQKMQQPFGSWDDTLAHEVLQCQIKISRTASWQYLATSSGSPKKEMVGSDLLWQWTPALLLTYTKICYLSRSFWGDATVPDDYAITTTHEHTPGSPRQGWPDQFHIRLGQHTPRTPCRYRDSRNHRIPCLNTYRHTHINTHTHTT